MEVTICRWYSACKNQPRNKTSSHIIPSGMKGRVQTLCQNCASGDQNNNNNNNNNKNTRKVTEKQEAATMVGSETKESVDRKVLDGLSRGLNTASMPADRAQVNQGVGKVPKPIPASLRNTPARKLGKALSRMASRQNSRRSSFSFKKTANRSQLPT